MLASSPIVPVTNLQLTSIEPIACDFRFYSIIFGRHHYSSMHCYTSDAQLSFVNGSPTLTLFSKHKCGEVVGI